MVKCGRVVMDNTVLSLRSINSTAFPGEHSRKASYVISFVIDQNDSGRIGGAHLVGCKAIVQLNDCNLVSPLAPPEPRLREDLVGTSPCHGKPDELHCSPGLKCFDTIGHQCIPRDLYRLILQPTLVDKIRGCDDTTCCTVLKKSEILKSDKVGEIDAY
jgi:hypothetical protein